jgi:hypothetical protein
VLKAFKDYYGTLKVIKGHNGNYDNNYYNILLKYFKVSIKEL